MCGGLAKALLRSKEFSWSVSLFLSLSFIPAGGAAAAAPAAEFNPVGLWHAKLSLTENNPVEFQVRISKKGNGLAASLTNGAVSEAFTSASWDGRTLTLEMAHYDAKILAAPKDGDLDGTFVRIVATGRREFPFSASRTASALPSVKKSGISLAGTWAVEIAQPGGTPENAIALLSQMGMQVTGTMATASGDYGPLHGTFDGEDLVLTVFNGVFAYRFTAELLPDGTLAGEFRSGKNPPVDWKARRQPAIAEFPGLKPREPEKPFVFSLPDMDAKILASADARFAGKALLVTAMGSWCPNCHDEAPVLEDLYRRYRGRGLEVVAFTYEATEDMERNRRLVGQFQKRHGVRYPILYAGTTKNAETSPLFSRLDGPRAFPTTLFLDTQHRIVKVHSGFDGPATGGRFRKLKKEWDETVRKLLGLDAAEFVVPDATSLTLK